jgi:hypothetical protein
MTDTEDLSKLDLYTTIILIDMYLWYTQRGVRNKNLREKT